MFRKAVVLVTFSLIAGNLAAAEFLPEARKSSGYGPTREIFSTWYAGACAERIGASVSYAGRASTEEVLPELLQYARDSVPHLLTRCPQAETIEVTAEGQPARPRLFYHFVMRRGSDWAPTNVKSNTDLVATLLDSGYVPAYGPKALSPRSFLRYVDGRFDAIYGKAFDGRMVATTVERYMQEGAEPPRLSHYTVRGHWYELGDERPQGSCDQSLDGYPLWGSFSMDVNPWSNDIRMQRKRCADHGDIGVSEQTTLSNLRQHDLAEFGIEPVEISKALSDAFAASASFAESVDLDEYARTRQPLYESANLRLYASRPELCTHRQFDAIYRVNSERRDSEFGGNYAGFIGNLLKRVTAEHCSNPLTASVDNYSLGDTDEWDHMSFQFRPLRPSPFGIDNDYLELLDSRQSERAKAHDAWLAANLLGPACSGAPFCELPGGRYLNAIYRGDLDGVRKMDYLYAESIAEFLNGSMPDDPNLGPVTQLFESVLGAKPVHLMREAANKYLYSYAAWGEACLDPGAQAYTFEYTTPLVIETDMDGITTSSGGDHYEATYTLNPEFFPLRDRVGSAYGAADSDNPWNLPGKSQVFRGIVEMKRSYGCRSDEVKEFERQLRTLTARVLDQPGTVAPANSERPPVVERTVADEFPPIAAASAPARDPVERLAPQALPAVASPVRFETTPSTPADTANRTSAPAAGATENSRARRGATAGAGSAQVPNVSSMNAVERQQQMSREMQELQQRTMAEMNELNQWMQQASRAATSADERTRILADYQSKIADLQSRAQSAVQEIRQKYQ